MPKIDGRHAWQQRPAPRGAGPAAAALALVLLLTGCSAFSPSAPPPTAPVVEAPPPALLPPPPVTVYVPVVEPADQAARQLLAYQERLAQLSPQALGPELQRLNDGSASAQTTMELALLLASTRAPGDLQKALALLDLVQRDPRATAWHGLARLLASRFTEQRRAEELAERLAQQLRDTQRENQRRLDLLNEKLEALKAIERSMNSRPPVPGSPGSPASPSALPSQRPAS